MGARESLVDCQPRKSGINDSAKFEGARGGGGGERGNQGFGKFGGGGGGGQNICLENAGLSFLHR